jgi:predicted GIY-YIG superfamily endonuclease
MVPLREKILVGIAIVLVLAVMLVCIAIIILAMTMDQQRRRKFWDRWMKRQHSQQKQSCKTPTTVSKITIANGSKNNNSLSIAYDNEMSLRTYARQQKEQIIKEQLHVVAQEVQVWRNIQSDVRCQLNSLTKAIQQIKNDSVQSRLPSLTKVD